MTRRGASAKTDRAFGAWGEQLASDYLKSLGWEILDHNWRCSAGELDIVAAEPGAPRNGALVFVEVKTRGGHGYGQPLEAITFAKLRRLRDLSWLWLEAHRDQIAAHIGGTGFAPQIRIDGIGVVRTNGKPILEHVRGLTS